MRAFSLQIDGVDLLISTEDNSHGFKSRGVQKQPPSTGPPKAMVPNDADLSVSQSRWKLFFSLMVLAAVASLASIPFEIASLSHELAEVPWWAPIVAFLFGFIPTVAAAALGLATIATTTFDLPILKWMVHRQPEPERNKRTIIVRSLVWGTATFLVVHGFSQWMEPLLEAI